MQYSTQVYNNFYVCMYVCMYDYTMYHANTCTHQSVSLYIQFYANITGWSHGENSLVHNTVSIIIWFPQQRNGKLPRKMNNWSKCSPEYMKRLGMNVLYIENEYYNVSITVWIIEYYSAVPVSVVYKYT